MSTTRIGLWNAEPSAEADPEPPRCLEWQQVSAGHDLVGTRRYCLGPRGHDEHDFEEVPPPVIHSHDAATGAIDLEGPAGQRVHLKHGPGSITGFTIALYAEDGPHFVHDPHALSAWHGPLTAGEANAVRDSLGKPPMRRDSEEEFM